MNDICGLNKRTLICNAVANAGLNQSPKRPRWSAVADVLAVGHNSAFALCREFGFDPDEYVGREQEEEEEKCQ